MSAELHAWEEKKLVADQQSAVMVCAKCGQVQSPFTKPCRGKR